VSDRIDVRTEFGGVYVQPDICNGAVTVSWLVRSA
jgi:hypothetical protein